MSKNIEEMQEKYVNDEESIKTFRIGRNMFYVKEKGDVVDKIHEEYLRRKKEEET